MKVKVIKIKKGKDKRGWLAELMRSEHIKGEFGQIYVTLTKPGFVRGKHYHKIKLDCFVVLKGRRKLTLLHIKTKRKRTIILDEKELKAVIIPPYYVHSIKSIGKKEMLLLSYTSEAFNPKNTDTYYVLAKLAHMR